MMREISEVDYWRELEIEWRSRLEVAESNLARLRALLAEIAKEASDHMQPFTLKDDGLRRVRDKALYELTPDPNVQIEILRTGKPPCAPTT